MRGNGSCVLDREPDIVLFDCVPAGMFPDCASAREMQADARWRTNYRCVQLRCPDPVTRSDREASMRRLMWIRIDGRLGIRSNDCWVRIPGMLLGSYRQPCGLQERGRIPVGMAARLVRKRDLAAAAAWQAAAPIVTVPVKGGVEAEVVVPGVGGCHGVRVGAGNWRVVIEPPDAPVDVRIMRGEEEVGCRWRAFELAHEVEVDLLMSVRPDAALPVRIRAVSLVRSRAASACWSKSRTTRAVRCGSRPR